jgi:hypothetical protein
MNGTSTNRKTALVVLGLNRSGGAVLAKALSHFGYALAVDISRPRPEASRVPPEPRAIMNFNRKVLTSLGATWNKPGPFLLEKRDISESRSLVADAVSESFENEAVEVFRKSFDGSSPIVVQDPRMCLLTPLWLRAIATAGYEPKCLLIYRNPLEVGASLAEKNGVNLHQSLFLWQQYNISALEGMLAQARGAVLEFGSLVADPLATIRGALERVEEAGQIAADGKAKVRSLIQVSGRRHIFKEDDLIHDVQISNPVKHLWATLRGWNDAGETRTTTIVDLRAALDDAVLTAGMPIDLTDEKISSLSPSEEQPRSPVILPSKPETRVLVIHYHLFKNAGTSVDDILKRNFTGHWAQMEFARSGGPRSNVRDVTEYIKSRPGLAALSSHTALLPLPQTDGIKILPIVFIRHPIDRLRSAYDFERRQSADTDGARLAKTHDFAGYLRVLLRSTTGNRQAKNFQTSRLSYNEPRAAGTELERAHRTLQSLPFVGLVEAYDRSVERLEAFLRPYFPEFSSIVTHKNVSRKPDSSLDDRLAAVAGDIGEDLYKEISAANSDDLEIYQSVLKTYDTAAAAA